MKKSLLISFFVFLLKTPNASAESIQIIMFYDSKTYDAFINDKDHKIDDSKASDKTFKIISSEKDVAKIAHRKNGERGQDNYKLVIYCPEKKGLKDVVSSVKLTGEKEGINIEKREELKARDEFYFTIDLNELGDAPGNKEIITVTVTGKNDVLLSKGYFKYFNDSQLYPNYGFWLPVGLFSSDLRKDSLGLTFFAHPIGFAWGNKFNFKNWYLGTSLAFNYTVSRSRTNENVYFNDASTTALIDINGFGYVGYNVPWDLGKSQNNSFVIGVGANLIQLLRGEWKGNK